MHGSIALHLISDASCVWRHAINIHIVGRRVFYRDEGMPTSLERLRKAISARYEIKRELGHGAMATVFLARDLKQDRDVAVKVLRDDVGVARGHERFRREIELVTHLNHPHILPIFDSGEVNGDLFHVMPYVEPGCKERDKVRVPGSLSKRLSAPILAPPVCSNRMGHGPV